MTDYIDRQELAEAIPPGHPLERYRARIVAAAELGEDAAVREIVEAAVEEQEAQELSEKWAEEFGPGAVDLAGEGGPGVSDDGKLARLQAKLRKLARRMNELDEDDPELDELRAEYKRLQRKLREFGDIPEENLTEQAVDATELSESGDETPGRLSAGEKQFVDDMLASYPVTRQEPYGRPEEGDGPGENPSRYMSAEQFAEFAREDDAAPTVDQETTEALRQQEIEDRFGPDPGDSVSDEDAWRALADSWGLEEE